MKFRSEYIKNASFLTIGILIAQSIGVIIAPIISRIYSPEAFGKFSFYLSSVILIEVCASLRYELAIVLPKSEKKASILFWMSTYITLLISLIAIIVIIGIKYSNILSQSWDKAYMLIPISIISISLVNIQNLWCTRKKYFKYLAISQPLVVILNNIFVIYFGKYFSGEYIYLIYSYITSYLIVMAIGYIYIFTKESKILLSTIFQFNYKEMFLKYKRMALYNTPGSIFNIISQRLPVFFLPVFFSYVVVGYYEIVYRVLKLPTQIIGNSIKNVFFQKANEEYLEKGSFKNIITQNVNILLNISLYPFLLLGITSPYIFGMIFGEKWTDAGNYSLVLMPWIFMSFIASPISQSISIISKDKLFFYLQLICFFLRAICIFIGGYFIKDPLITILLFSLIGFLYQSYVVKILCKSANINLMIFFRTNKTYIITSMTNILIVYLLYSLEYFHIGIALSIIGLITYCIYIYKQFVLNLLNPKNDNRHK